MYTEREHPQPTAFLGIIPATIAYSSGTVRARVCGNCGHVDLFSPEAGRMWAEYSAAPAAPPAPPAHPAG